MNLEEKLLDYMKSTGIVFKGDQIVKKAEIEINMSIAAFNSKFKTIKQGLMSNWECIIGKQLTDSDISFVNDYHFLRQKNYDLIKSYGYSNIKDKAISLDYLRAVWFFAYLGLNFKNLNKDELEAKIIKMKNEEKNLGYFKDDNFKYVLEILFDNYCYFIENAVEIGKLVNEKYSKRLNENLQTCINLLMEEDDLKYGELQYIFELEKLNAQAEEITKTVENEDKNNKTFEYKNTTDYEIDTLKAQIEQLKMDIDIKSTELEKAKVENEKSRIRGAEEILRCLNDEKYSCILDKLLEIKTTKQVNPEEVINISIQFYNALKSLDYMTFPVKYQNLPIDKDIPVTELGKYYRWDNDSNISNKEMLIVSPGLKHRWTKCVIYNPKIQEK